MLSAEVFVDSMITHLWFNILPQVQAFFGDGSASLHTRNLNKYGKLRNGSLVVVPSALIKRSKSHFVSLPCGIDLVLGLNGYVYVQKHVEINEELIADPNTLYSDKNSEISGEERLMIARVCNIVRALADNRISIYDSIIQHAYEASLSFPCKDLCNPITRKTFIEEAFKLMEEQ